MSPARAFVLLCAVGLAGCAPPAAPPDPAGAKGGGEKRLLPPFWMYDAHLRGAVQADGQALSGATVNLELLLGSRAVALGARRSDAAGAFRFGPLPAGAYRLRVGAPERAELRRTLWLEPGENRMDPVALQRSAPIAGRVVNDRGEEVAWAVLRVTPVGGTPGGAVTVKADNRGRFYAEGLYPGPHQLRVEAAQHAPAVRRAVRAPARSVRLRLTRLYQVRGQVTGLPDPGEGPASTAARVRLVGSGLWPGKTAEVQADGAFTVEGVPAGIYELMAWAEGPPPLASGIFAGLEVGPEEPKPLSLTLLPAQALRGRVLHGGEPVAGAVVALSRGALAVLRQRAVTDEKGRFSLDPVVLGSYRLAVWARGYLPLLDREVALPQPGPLDLSLTAGATVRGRVVDEAGYPLADASVWVVYGGAAGKGTGPRGEVGELGVVPGPVPPIPPGDGSWVSPTPGSPARRSAGRSDAEGRFELAGLWPGRARLVVDLEGYSQARSPWLELSAAEELELAEELVLQAASSLEGQVLDERGLPLSGARIALSAAGEDRRTLYSDAAGRFEAAGLTGKVSLEVSLRGYLDRAAEATLGRGERRALDLVLEPARGQVEGYVLDPGRLPLSGARVVARRGRHRVEGQSGRSGHFLLEGVGQGPLSLEVTREQYLPWRRQVTPGGSGTVEVRLRPAAALRGVVVDARTGAPISRFRVEASQPGGPRQVWDTPAEAGEFLLRGLSPGPLRLEARAEGYARLVRTVTLPEPRQPGEVAPRGERLELSPAGVVFGRVVDGRGRSVAGAAVSAGGVSERTDRRGRFRLEGVPEGSQTLRGSADGPKSTGQPAVEQSVVVRAGQPLGPLRLELR